MTDLSGIGILKECLVVQCSVLNGHLNTDLNIRHFEHFGLVSNGSLSGNSGIKCQVFEWSNTIGQEKILLERLNFT